MKLGRREATFLGLGTFAALGLGLWFWPSREGRAAYPFVRRIAGGHDPLWRVAPDELQRASERDAAQLGELIATLERAIARLESQRALLGTAKVDDLSHAERKKIRELFWQVLEPIVALDD